MILSQSSRGNQRELTIIHMYHHTCVCLCLSLSVSVCLCSVWKDKTMHNSVILIQRCDAPEWGGGARGEAGVPAGDTIHLT